jgi:putative addiction module component (TIGR02574 family)
MDLPRSIRDRVGATPRQGPSPDGGRPVPFIMANEEHMSVEELERAALKLPPVERERLATKLLSSLETRLEFEAEWIDEVKRRAREIDEGTVETIPADQVIREALDRLK